MSDNDDISRLMLEMKHQSDNQQRQSDNQQKVISELVNNVTQLTKTMGRIEVFQVEINHVNKSLDGLTVEVSRVNHDIGEIKGSMATDSHIIDELNQSRKWVVRFLGALFLAGCATIFMPKDNTMSNALVKQSDSINKLAEVIKNINN